jgi:hypothetical protein
VNLDNVQKQLERNIYQKSFMNTKHILFFFRVSLKFKNAIRFFLPFFISLSVALAVVSNAFCKCKHVLLFLQPAPLLP